MEYTVHQLAKLAGITPRTLRWYDKINLLSPQKRSENGYRLYGEEEIKRLQEILLYRDMGIALKEIPPLLSKNEQQRRQILTEHLIRLRKEEERLQRLIQTVQQTIQSEQGGIEMQDWKKFEGFKQEKWQENEQKYGSELREKYGEDTVKESKDRFLSLKQEEYQEMKELEEEIRSLAEQAVRESADPAGNLGKQLYELHRKWLSFSWNQYSKQAHLGLVQMYVADPRFTEYYDRNLCGCAEFLHDAVVANLSDKMM